MRLLLVKLPAPRNWLKQECSAWVFSSDLLHGLPENELKTELRCVLRPLSSREATLSTAVTSHRACTHSSGEDAKPQRREMIHWKSLVAGAKAGVAFGCGASPLVLSPALLLFVFCWFVCLLCLFFFFLWFNFILCALV